MRWTSLILIPALSVMGCSSQSSNAGEPSAEQALPARAALLLSGDERSLAHLKDQLGDLVGRANIELGASDPTIRSSVSVLPPRPGSLETHNVSLPTVFDLILKNGDCFVVRQETGEETRLQDVTCVPDPGAS